MAQNFLYMLEFVVDDLLITHPNECAPEEYPTCVELTFRSSVFVQICDRDFGGCVDIRNLSKSGKCCLFGLESPITQQDKLLVHVYKKKIERCKFLLGTTDISVKALFDRVTSDFMQNNPLLAAGSKTESNLRQEEFCPSSEIEKKLLSLFDLQGRQTGNMVLIVRLSCMGPTIVSPFPFVRGTAHECGGSGEASGYRAAAGNNDEDLGQSSTVDYSKKSRKHKHRHCRRGSTDDQSDFDRDSNAERHRGGNDLKTSRSSFDSSSQSIVARQKAGKSTNACKPVEYDEFEADMNGSGLAIRLLKDCFDVNVQDSDYESDGAKHCHKKGHVSKVLSYNNRDFQRSAFLQNQIRSQLGGNFVNRRGLPPIRGNIKYAANEQCPAATDFELPMPMVRKCGREDKSLKYRKRCAANRCCCIQVAPDDIDDTLSHINRKTKGNGIEVCRKKCIDEDSDVFVFKLGKKKQCANKQHLIEVELRTPKVPTVLQRQEVAVHTQIDEAELDAELRNICMKKKPKKKNKKK